MRVLWCSEDESGTWGFGCGKQGWDGPQASSFGGGEARECWLLGVLVVKGGRPRSRSALGAEWLLEGLGGVVCGLRGLGREV